MTATIAPPHLLGRDMILVYDQKFDLQFLSCDSNLHHVLVPPLLDAILSESSILLVQMFTYYIYFVRSWILTNSRIIRVWH